MYCHVLDDSRQGFGIKIEFIDHFKHTTRDYI
jgi:hypothetical protein